MRNLYTGDTRSDIDSAFLLAKLLGIISQNIRSRKVMAQVAIATATASSIQEF